METCITCFSTTMPDSSDDSTVCESIKKFIKYTKEQVNRSKAKIYLC